MPKSGVLTGASLKDRASREDCFKNCMMKTITCKQLRQLISDILAPIIDDIRAKKENQFFYEFDVAPTDDEIDEFIELSSLDEEMKNFLLENK